MIFFLMPISRFPLCVFLIWTSVVRLYESPNAVSSRDVFHHTTTIAASQSPYLLCTHGMLGPQPGSVPDCWRVTTLVLMSCRPGLLIRCSLCGPVCQDVNSLWAVRHCVAHRGAGFRGAIDDVKEYSQRANTCNKCYRPHVSSLFLVRGSLPSLWFDRTWSICSILLCNKNKGVRDFSVEIGKTCPTQDLVKYRAIAL